VKVSVILTSYNRPKGVVDAINSVKSQTYGNWELIVVDDNSDGATVAAIQGALGTDVRCRLLTTRVKPEERLLTARYCTAINLAIPYATGELITYLTDDDIFYPQRLEKFVEVFQNPDVFVAYGQQRMVHVRDDGARVDSGLRPMLGVTRTPMTHVDHNSFMHRQACFRIVGGWDDSPQNWSAGDLVFFKKLVKYWPFYPVNFVTDEHRFHSNSVQARCRRGESVVGNKHYGKYNF
jgi:spore maturation protein CgeD